MTIIDSREAGAELALLIRRALAGERIVIALGGKPVVQLVPYTERGPRIAGLWKGKVTIAEDFDAPLDLIADASDRTADAS